MKTVWKHKKIGKYDTYPSGQISQARFAHVIAAEMGCDEVEPIDAYKKIFRLGEGYIQKAGEYNDGTAPIKGNPIAYYKEHKCDKTGHFHIMREDTFKDDLKTLQKADFAILNAVSYYGRKNIAAHQDRCFALIFDIDGVLDVTIPRLWGMSSVGQVPMPNFVALSGHGLHLYYLFDEPVRLYPETKVQLKAMKYDLTRRLWWDRLSCDENVQYQGLNQGFRPLGGKTKNGKRVRVFETREQRWSIKELNSFVNLDHQVEPQQVYKASKYTLEEAKKKWPAWYERVIVNGEKNTRRWKTEDKVNGSNQHALYDWWLRKVNSGAVYHHRYFCVMMMYIYGVKNGVPKDKVTQDALNLLPFFNSLPTTGEEELEPFTEEDIKSASDCYDERFATFPIKDISKLSGIAIEPNKRNGRAQADHLKIARFACDINNPGGSWREGSGRKPLKDKVLFYAVDHPDATPTQAARDLGISRTTVYKWWPK